MKLSDLFSTTTQNISSGNSITDVPTDPYQQQRLNQELRGMKPGQTLQGEVVSKNGNEVQIRLHDDLVLTARLDKNIEMEPGKVVTFEVRNNSGSTLALSPLFENMGTDANVLKALDMAGLPVNQTTIDMTEAMMQGGMSIDKNSLSAMFKQVVNFPKHTPASVVTLTRLGVELTPQNLQQLENYQNLEHQIVKDMTNILEEIPFQYESLLQEGDTQKAVALYEAVLKLVTEELMPEGAESTEAAVLMEEKGTVPQGTAETAGTATQGTAETAGTATQDTTAKALEETVWLEDTQADKTVGEASETSEKEVQLFLQELQKLGIEPETLQAFASGRLNGKELLYELARVLEQLSPEGRESLTQPVFSNKAFQNLLQQTLNKQWLLTPGEVQEKGKVEALYERLHTQLGKLSEALDKAVHADNPLAKSVTNLQNNLDFMNQLNQVYTYVQLPLKMTEGKAHGDLYVYTNKKSLASKEGSISALLHLDMEHLGPVDVYVAMQEQKVNTHFYLPDEEMLTFIEKHLYLLNERLAQKGYVMNTKASIRNDKKNVVEEILDRGTPVTKLSQYSFDVRA